VAVGAVYAPVFPQQVQAAHEDFSPVASHGEEKGSGNLYATPEIVLCTSCHPGYNPVAGQQSCEFAKTERPFV